MEIHLKLSSKELIEKEFPFDGDGYNAYDVDEFIDNIISDYMLVESNVLLKKGSVEVYLKRIEDLNKELKELKIELDSYHKKFDGIKDSNGLTSDNLEYVRKIAKYENEFKRRGIDPNKIK